jgi:hypothetical protein
MEREQQFTEEKAKVVCRQLNPHTTAKEEKTRRKTLSLAAL